MNFKLHIPIYLQIEEKLKLDIALGHLMPGQQLPSVRDLSATLKVNPNTVQRAFQSLEDEGICLSHRGLGRFVSEEAGLPQRLRLSMVQLRTQEYLEAIQAFELDGATVLAVVQEQLGKHISNPSNNPVIKKNEEA